MLNAAAKSSCFKVQVIKKKVKKVKKKIISIPVVEDGANRLGVVL